MGTNFSSIRGEGEKLSGGGTLTSGGSEALTIMGGFIGSALFGNLLFYTGLKANQTTKVFAFLLIILFIYRITWRWVIVYIG